MEDLNQYIQQKTVDAISNLATAIAEDRSTVGDLTATNSRLSEEIIVVNQILVKIMEENKKLRAKTARGSLGEKHKVHKTEGIFYCFRCDL